MTVLRLVITDTNVCVRFSHQVFHSMTSSSSLKTLNRFTLFSLFQHGWRAFLPLFSNLERLEGLECLEGLERLEDLQRLHWLSRIGSFVCLELLKGPHSLEGLEGVECLECLERLERRYWSFGCFFDF